MEISHPDNKTKKCVLSSYSINTILGEHLEPWLLALEPLTVKSLKICIWLTGIKSVKIKKKNQPSCLSISWWSLLFSKKKTRRFKKYRVATLHHFELNQSFHFRKPFFKMWFLNKAHLLSLKYANFANIVFINCIRLTLILLRQQYLQTKRYQFLKKYLG